MIPENRIPTHPGEILREEFLEPMGLAQTTLAEKLEMATTSNLPAGNESSPSPTSSGTSKYSVEYPVSGVSPASVRSPRLGSEATTFDRSTNPGSVRPSSISSRLAQRTPLIAMNPIRITRPTFDVPPSATQVGSDHCVCAGDAVAGVVVGPSSTVRF